MSTAVRVENISKRYIIKHKSHASYPTMRDFMYEKATAVFKKKNNITANTTEDFWALRDVSFEINKGDKVGIIGKNGAGKSTLLKILSRITEPTNGKISIKGRVASLLEVGTGFHPELTGRENIFLNGAILGMRKVEIASRFDEIVAFSGVEKFLDTPVKRYSSGMYVRLAFAVAAHLETEILIVDEVLAVGDADFQKKCLGKMQDVSKQDGRTILFVSHNMAAMKQICTNGILLSGGNLLHSGSMDDVIETYQSLSEKSKKELTDLADRKGEGSCRLSYIKLTSVAGSEKSIFKLGEKIKFVLGIKNMTGNKISDIRIIIGIYNKFDESYVRFDSKASDTSFVITGSDSEITCTMDEHVNIRPDNYSINIAIFANEVLLDHAPRCITFRVDNVDYFNSGRDMQDAALSKVFYKHSWAAN